MFDNTLDYIHQNPVVAGFVTKQEDWSIVVHEIFAVRKD